MKAYNDPNNFGLNLLKLLKEFEISKLWDRNALFWISYQHLSDHFDRF